RSRRVHEAALAAARSLLAEGGLGAATVDAISERSGVSKATLYKHWPSRTAIAAEALGRDNAVGRPLPDNGSTAGDLTEYLVRVCAFYASPEGRVFSQLLAACVTDAGAAAYFRVFFLAGRRKALATLWQRGVERGDAAPGVDADTAVDLLSGPLVFRLLSGHRPLDEASARVLAHAALHGLLAPTTRT
ncbi:MAG: TetR/AcrR family transcriptional regulator, partial [Nocardioidaceae bacterium]